MIKSKPKCSFYRWIIPHCIHPIDKCNFSVLAKSIVGDRNFPDIYSRGKIVEYFSEHKDCSCDDDDCALMSAVNTAITYYQRETGVKLED